MINLSLKPCDKDNTLQDSNLTCPEDAGKSTSIYVIEEGINLDVLNVGTLQFWRKRLGANRICEIPRCIQRSPPLTNFNL